jgi:hypothetical protein
MRTFRTLLLRMRWNRSCVKMRSACYLRTAVNSLALLGTREVLTSILTAIILHDDEEDVVPDEKRATFYAAAELAVRYFSLTPETYSYSRIMT